MFEKCDVNGPDAHEVYRFLRLNSSLHDADSGETSEVPWSFAKFLVDSDGEVVSYHKPTVYPSELRKDIEKLL